MFLLYRFWLSPVYVLAQLAYAKHFLRHTSMKNTATQTRRNISQHYDLVSTHVSSFVIEITSCLGQFVILPLIHINCR